MTAGAPLTGFLVWSFLDTFEWTYGHEPRFGIVHVDYADAAPSPRRACSGCAT
ncbi:family 1 glycosylhydrolase [Nonomuraea dietziae]|uniref:family 1 glycosylhydrolase n=1 Tax=Nonomuraea dietziae TaxID=65515 RepID=UPI0033DD2C4F